MISNMMNIGMYVWLTIRGLVLQESVQRSTVMNLSILPRR